MASKNTQHPDSFVIRKAVRYLEDVHGIDIGELSLRNKVRTHEIFTNDPGTVRGGAGETDRNEWHISRTALDAYAAAHKAGNVRTTSTDGAKAYKLNVNSAHLAELRQWAKDRGLAEPVRANKQYAPKAKLAANVAGAEVQPVEELFSE